MKTTFTIIVETKNFNIDNETIREEIENELHKGVEMWVRQYLTEEALTDAIINDYILDYQVTPIDGLQDLSDYGDIKVGIKANGNEEETLINIQSGTPTPKIDEDENYKTELVVEEELLKEDGELSEEVLQRHFRNFCTVG